MSTNNGSPETAIAPPASAAVTPKFAAEVRDAISVRTIGLVVGVLFLQLGFILSYVGAFHATAPHRIDVAVVAPAQVSDQLVAGLNGITAEPLVATATDEATARGQLARNEISAVLIVDGAGTQDTLLVASAGGTSVSTAVQLVITQAEAAQSRTITVEDVIPVQAGDGRGLSGFYAVLGWIIGGYLLSALLGVAKGSRPANLQRASIRLGATVPYAILSGLGGALLLDQILGAVTGHFFGIWGLGTLLVLMAGAVAMAMQTLFGVIGIGVTILLFVILGNPSAGGAYQPELLPTFWRVLHNVLPTGAGTDAFRSIAYFDSNGLAGPILVIVAYLVGGVLLTLGAARFHGRRGLAA